MTKKNSTKASTPSKPPNSSTSNQNGTNSTKKGGRTNGGGRGGNNATEIEMVEMVTEPTTILIKMHFVGNYKVAYLRTW